jgi:hypothetical protein
MKRRYSEGQLVQILREGEAAQRAYGGAGSTVPDETVCPVFAGWNGG